jgi:hypothetical protein
MTKNALLFVSLEYRIFTNLIRTVFGDFFFGVDESNIRLWQKHKADISGCAASLRKFTGPKTGQFPETDDFFKRDARMDY